MSSYCTIADLRSEGVPVSYTDAQVQAAIDRASLKVERYTGRFFEPRSQTIVLDGTGRPGLLLGDPIISISLIQILDIDMDIGVDVDLIGARIYNRHLTQNLTNPDDRDNPRIELPGSRWPSGKYSVQITGVFGYTDYDGGVTAEGITPPLIARATCLMALKEIAPRYGSSGDDARDARMADRIIELRTRDQSIKYAGPSAATGSVGAITGDPEVDDILASYTRPPALGAA